MTHTALLLIDAQVNMFAPGCAVFDAENKLKAITTLIQQARTAQAVIIHIQNNGGESDPDAHGSVGWEIHPAATPLPGEIIIQKHTPDAFNETPLQSGLDARQVKNIIIAGMQTDFCIDATCRRAHQLGYQVTLVADAHSTYAADDLTAASVIAQYNAELGKIISVMKSESILF